MKEMINTVNKLQETQESSTPHHTKLSGADTERNMKSGNVNDNLKNTIIIKNVTPMKRENQPSMQLAAGSTSIADTTSNFYSELDHKKVPDKVIKETPYTSKNSNTQPQLLRR